MRIPKTIVLVILAATASLPATAFEIETSMIVVDGGSFVMGCTDEQELCGADEGPLRTVTVPTFRISRYEVTQGLWTEIMGSNPSAFRGCKECPVETVSWDDIQLFFERLNSEGRNYRLPSESEWEFVARGGNLGEGFQLSGGNNWDEVAWIFRNSGNRTQPVALKAPNELGVYDMSGNVREWVEDCWNPTYAGAPIDGSAWTDGDCSNRVMRGGSWYGKWNYVRVANRFWYGSFFKNNNLGFRIAESIEDD